jgi:hypothetical protein
MKGDRLDVDRLQRIRETDVWVDYERRIRTRFDAAVRSCLNPGNDEKALRLAQGSAEALRFVLELPDAIEKEIKARSQEPGARSQNAAD